MKNLLIYYILLFILHLVFGAIFAAGNLMETSTLDITERLFQMTEWTAAGFEYYRKAS
ncbi:hypothetical protein [Flavilitoribacter nigricans]|uniref:hypothetical protein n=1 Tax=Flavilitoribacter nigricans TaxID=70997 RepID=UPI001473DC63|nr:hypothetical protein [Flavilitoribacter nigricans]